MCCLEEKEKEEEEESPLPTYAAISSEERSRVNGNSDW